MWLGRQAIRCEQGTAADFKFRSRGLLAGGTALLAIATGLLAPAGGAAAETATVSERVQAHLEAGEFGTALALAQQAGDATDALLANVAQAQLAAGEVSGARRTERRISTAGQVAQRGAALAGGGSMANPGPLIQMIQQLTGGDEADPPAPWFDISGSGGAISWDNNGVMVDPQGILRRLTSTEQSGRLNNLGVQARTAALNDKMSQPSALRFVSLARLEKAAAERAAEGLPVLETMRHMAGLSRIQYVIAVPEEHDVLIAGPAEGWKYNAQGLAVGAVNGQPTLQLDDLVTVLRTFGPGGQGIFGCSINPRPDNLKATKEYVEVSQKSGSLSPAGKAAFFKGIQERMGLQDIEIYGIAPNNHVAKVLVAADYRMKLIGIGKLEGGPNIPSIFELLPQYSKDKSQPLDALRWWLTMNYDGILHSPDRQVFEIRGSSVLVLSEDQMVTATGERIHTGKASPINQAFARKFTENYAELAKQDLVFAELQNIFDLGMVAALVHSEKLATQAGWKPTAFAADGSYRPATVATAKTVESVLHHKTYNGQDLVVQVAGGVRGDVLAIARDQKKQQASEDLNAVETQAQKSRLPGGRWWWDAAAAK